MKIFTKLILIILKQNISLFNILLSEKYETGKCKFEKITGTKNHDFGHVNFMINEKNIKKKLIIKYSNYDIITTNKVCELCGYDSFISFKRKSIGMYLTKNCYIIKKQQRYNNSTLKMYSLCIKILIFF